MIYPFNLFCSRFRKMVQVTVKTTRKVAAISHRHVDVDPRGPIVPVLTYITATQNRVLENCRRDLNFAIEPSDGGRQLFYEGLNLLLPVVVKEVAHVWWTTGNGATVHYEVDFFATVHLIPITRQHRWITPPVSFYSRLIELDSITLFRTSPVTKPVSYTHLRAHE